MPIKDLSTEQLLVEMREIHAAMMSASRRAIMESARLSRFQAELEYRAEKTFVANGTARSTARNAGRFYGTTEHYGATTKSPGVCDVTVNEIACMLYHQILDSMLALRLNAEVHVDERDRRDPKT